MTTEKKANVCANRPIFSEVLRVLSNIKVCELASQAHTLPPSFWQTRKSVPKPFLWDVLYDFCDSSIKFINIFRPTN